MLLSTKRHLDVPHRTSEEMLYGVGEWQRTTTAAKIVFSKDTKEEIVSATIEFRHNKLTIPSVTQEEKVLHGVQQLMVVLKDTPASKLY